MFCQGLQIDGPSLVRRCPSPQCRSHKRRRTLLSIPSALLSWSLEASPIIGLRKLLPWKDVILAYVLLQGWVVSPIFDYVEDWKKYSRQIDMARAHHLVFISNFPRASVAEQTTPVTIAIVDEQTTVT